MRTRLPVITESVEELEALLKTHRDPHLRRRIHLLLLIASGQAKTRRQAAVHLAVHRNTVRNWLLAYQEGGLESMLRIEQGAPPAQQKSLPEPVYRDLKTRLDHEGFPDGYVQVQRWLEDEFAMEIPYKTIHGILYYRLKAKLKRARPSHVKKTKPRSPPSRPA